MRNDKPNIIVELTFHFALDIISYSEILKKNGKSLIAQQVLKSGTSIGANVREAQNAESKADFIHKMKIAAKEVDETNYWLELTKLSENYPYDEDLFKKAGEIEKVLSKIISTSKHHQIDILSNYHIFKLSNYQYNINILNSQINSQ